MKKLYVTDLDGTLLNRQDRISPFSVRVINELVDKGLLFTYATARSLVSASKVTEGLSTEIPVIAYNGAFIIQPSTGEILSSIGSVPLFIPLSVELKKYPGFQSMKTTGFAGT